MECDAIRSKRPQKTFSSKSGLAQSQLSAKKSLFKNCPVEVCGNRNIRFAIFCQQCGQKFPEVPVNMIGTGGGDGVSSSTLPRPKMAPSVPPVNGGQGTRPEESIPVDSSSKPEQFVNNVVEQQISSVKSNSKNGIRVGIKIFNAE